MPALSATSTTGTTVATGDFQRQRDKKAFFESPITLALAACLLISISVLGWLAWSIRQERQARQQSEELARQAETRRRELEQQLAQVEQSSTDELKRERDQRIAAETNRDQLLAQVAEQPSAKIIPSYSLRLSSERGAQDDLQLKFNASAPAMRLRLLITKPGAFPNYEVEFVDARGGVVRKISGLRASGDDGALSFRLDRAGFSTGKYKLRLFGRQGKTMSQLEEHELMVTVR